MRSPEAREFQHRFLPIDQVRTSWLVSSSSHGAAGQSSIVFLLNKVTTIYRYYLRIKFLIDRYRRQLILGVLSLIGTDVTGIALPWLIKEGIDAAVQKKAGRHLADLFSAD